MRIAREFTSDRQRVAETSVREALAAIGTHAQRAIITSAVPVELAGAQSHYTREFLSLSRRCAERLPRGAPPLGIRDGDIAEPPAIPSPAAVELDALVAEAVTTVHELTLRCEPDVREDFIDRVCSALRNAA